MSFKFLSLRDWYLVAPLGALGIVLAIWGFSSCSFSAHAGMTGLLPAAGIIITKTMGLVLLRGLGGGSCAIRPPLQLSMAQVLLPVTAFVGGLKLFLVNLRHDIRIARAKHFRDHVIVCGLGPTGRHIVHQMKDSGRNVVAIAIEATQGKDPHVDDLSVAVLNGDATKAHVLQYAGLHTASALVAVTGSDSQNLEIGLRARDLRVRRRGEAIKIMAEMHHGWLFDRLLTHPTAVLGTAAANFELFNLRSMAARALVQSEAFERNFTRAPLPAAPHFIFLGFGSLACELVHRLVCSSFAVPNVRLQITVLDQDVTAAEARLRAQWPGLARLADFEFLPVQWVTGGLAEADAGRIGAVLLRCHSVFITLPDEELALEAALWLRNALDRGDRNAIPIFLRIREQLELGRFLKDVEAQALLPDRLVPFGNLAELTTPAMLLNDQLDLTAFSVHEAYLNCRKPGDVSPSSVPWAQLPEGFKSSSRNQADHLSVALSAVGYRILPKKGNPIKLEGHSLEALAQLAHVRWLLERQAEGWAYGGERNDTLKLSPALKTWAEIDEETREIDRALMRRIQEILAGSGRSMIREQVIVLGVVPEADLEQMVPEALNVIVADPQSEDQLAALLGVIGLDHVRVRLVWRGSKPLRTLQARKDFAALQAKFEGWVLNA